MSERLTTYLDDDGVWCQTLSAPAKGASQPALILDRDGVVVEEVNYLSRAADVKLISGAAKVIAVANGRGIPAIFITNQAGIGRSCYGWEQFIEVQKEVLAQLARRGASVDAVFACPHHPDGVPLYAHPNHPARKPNPGMLFRAATALNVDLRSSWVIGDKASDLAAGRAAGLTGGLHVLTGCGPNEREAAASLGTDDFQVHLGDSIADALFLIPFLRGSETSR